MAILFGLGAALTYGAADFLGGLATRTTKVLSVVLISQVAGSLLLLLAFPFFTDVAPSTRALTWGGLSGLAGAAGVALFYQGLAIGRMGVIAPVTGVEAAALPVIFGLVTGERPTPLSLAGVVLALVAVALVSTAAGPDAPSDRAATEESRNHWTRSGLAHGLGAGLAFGAFFILLDQAGDDTGLWPLVGARLSSMGAIAVAVLITRRWERPQRRSLPLIAGAGVLDVTANLLFLLAARAGLLSIASVLTSMYPASTVLLARVTLGERFGRAQSIGLVVAVAGVVAIALG